MIKLVNGHAIEVREKIDALSGVGVGSGYDVVEIEVFEVVVAAFAVVFVVVGADSVVWICREDEDEKL